MVGTIWIPSAKIKKYRRLQNRLFFICNKNTFCLILRLKQRGLTLYKKLFSLFMIALLPICANATTCRLNSTNDGCDSYNGCYFAPAAGVEDEECKECPRGKYNNDNIAINVTTEQNCTACPADSTTSSQGATAVTDCRCTQPGHNLVPQSDGTYVCAPCPENAVYNNNQCECKAGYYKDGTTCAVCKYGKTSDQGARNESDCRMTHNTLFCDANGQNCMKLIP